MHARTLSTLIVLGFLGGGLPVAGAQAPPGGPELAYTDPKGDVGVFGLSSGATTTTTPLTDAADLVSFRLYGEDTEGFYVEIGVNQIKPNPQQVGNFGSYAYYDTAFKLDGTSFGYRLTFQITTSQASNPAGVVPIPTTFCVLDGSRSSCFLQRVFGSVDWDKSLLTAYVTKLALMGQDPIGDPNRRPGASPHIEVGSRLVEIRSQARGGLFGGTMTDVMPNQGTQGPYAMQQKAANDRIRLRLHHESLPGERVADPFAFGGQIHDFPQAAVSPGTTALIQIAVENLNAGKRLINLSAGLVDPKDASKWEVRIVSTITVPGEDKRIVNLIVNLTGNVEHRQSTLVRLHARSLGFPDETGVMKLRLLAAVPPSPQARDLFFHATGYSASGLCIGCSGGRSWLNTLETDPQGTSDDAVQFSSSSTRGLQGSEYSRTFSLDAPLNDDLVLRASEPIVATLSFRSDVPLSGTAKIEIYAGDVFVGAGEAPWSGSGAVSISFPPSLEAERIPLGTVLTARVILSTSQPIGFFSIGNEGRPEFVAKGSKITLPIIPDPKPRTKNAIPAGPAFLTLESKTDTEQFVNPGKVRVFQLTIVNEGVQEDVVEIETSYDAENWYVGLNPSNSYRLKPGESATFGVLVKPPAGAKEGEQCHIQLNATSGADPNALAQASLTAIVTTGVELEDEADNFTADEDTIEYAEEESKKKSPGIGLVAIAAAAAVAVVLRRRRT